VLKEKRRHWGETDAKTLNFAHTKTAKKVREILVTSRGKSEETDKHRASNSSLYKGDYN